ncbi:MAG: hypothetical protein OEV36_11160 [Myxococcales bacterium]|nr:hypothetical protein [Myxococcales bacterium]
MSRSDARLVEPAVAQPAPAWNIERWFNAPDDFSLDRLRGRVVALHAFQMLCPGCVAHGIPQAQRIAASFASEDVAVVGLHTVFEHHEAENVEYNIDAKRGYFLDATLQNETLVVTPGETVDLTINYRAWSREGCPACSYRIVVGFEGDYAGYAALGSGAYQETGGGSVGEAVISVTTPSTAGQHGIYAALNAGTPEEGEDLYESRFPDERRYIPLGILTVEE